jgi:arsenate reductase
MDATIYHNAKCGTSRNTLALIRNAGIEPVVVDYLATPPTKAELKTLIAAAGLSVREGLRQKDTPYAALGLDDLSLSDDVLLDHMIAEPILINRPFVTTPPGTRLCRPSEVVLDILPDSHNGPFTKEDGQKVIGEDGRRLA